ncbi:SPOR domain-containing protein [Hydrogenimonas sp.]
MEEKREEKNDEMNEKEGHEIENENGNDDNEKIDDNMEKSGKEEKSDELDNLIIQTEKPSGLKKLLLAAAILLLVLIIIILVTRSLVQPKQNPHSSIILPPEPVAQVKPPTKEPLFEEVPIQEEKETEEKVSKVIDNVKRRQPEPETTVKPVEKPKEVEKKPVKRVETLQEIEAKKVQKRVEKRAVATPVPPRPEPIERKREKKVSKKSYYIQVGAFFLYPPEKRFLESIEREGLHYVIVKGRRGGKTFKKVMVGPYATKSAAKRDLPRVKKRINQNAYITKK